MLRHSTLISLAILFQEQQVGIATFEIKPPEPIFNSLARYQLEVSEGKSLSFGHGILNGKFDFGGHVQDSQLLAVDLLCPSDKDSRYLADKYGTAFLNVGSIEKCMVKRA